MSQLSPPNDSMTTDQKDAWFAVGCLTIPLALIGLFMLGCSVYGTGPMIGLLFILGVIPLLLVLIAIGAAA